MTDIFFSYSSADRERVRPIRDALAAQGFEVFWGSAGSGGYGLGHLDSSASHQIQVRNGVLVGNVGLIRQRPP